MGQFLILEAGGVLIYGQAEKGNKLTMMLADITTGKPIWSSTTLFKKQPEMFTMRPNKEDRKAGYSR